MEQGLAPACVRCDSSPFYLKGCDCHAVRLIQRGRCCFKKAVKENTLDNVSCQLGSQQLQRDEGAVVRATQAYKAHV